MKQFKLIALVALTLGAQSAKAELGRATSADDVVAGSFVCETTGRVVKRHVASNETLSKTKQRDTEGTSGTTRGAQ